MLFENPDCVFIRIPKTASTSIVKGILKDANLLRVEFDRETFDQELTDLFSFAFVRNPYHRIASALRMFQNYRTKTDSEVQIKKKLDLDLALDIVEDESLPIDEDHYLSKLRLHHLPMTHPAMMLDKADTIARYEDLDGEVERLAKRLGIPMSPIPITRFEGTYDFRESFTARSKQRFENIFKFQPRIDTNRHEFG